MCSTGRISPTKRGEAEETWESGNRVILDCILTLCPMHLHGV